MNHFILLVLTCLIAFCMPAYGQGVENPFGSTDLEASSLRGDIYYLPEGTTSLPDFSALTPVGSVYAKVLDIPQRSFDSGFPGVSDRFEWFAIRYTGSFLVDRAGDYAFRLVSDDGSRLFIDENKIIDNDGQHPPQSQSGSVFLGEGVHKIMVDYFQGPRDYVALQLFWTVPGGSEEISTPEFTPQSALQPWDLTGIWDCDDGGTYYIRQWGNVVWWFGEPSLEPGIWSNVAKGTIINDVIKLDWSDVPKGSDMNGGILSLDIISKDRLTASERTGGFGGTVWTRKTSGQNGMGTGATYANPWEDPTVQGLIDEWLLQQDGCLKEVYSPGAYIDRWGRACGDLGTTTVSCTLTPDRPLDWDNYHYLWYNNWCPIFYPYAVQDYVQLREMGESFDSLRECKGEGDECY